MSIFVLDTMRNNHGAGVLPRLLDTLQLWRQRYRTRRELTQWTSRELQDIGLSWSDVACEANKPFWRA